MAEGKAPLSSFGVKAIQNNIVAITLKHPVPYFLRILSTANFSILSQAEVNKYGDSFTLPGHLVSSGAYALKTWKVGDKITAIKNKYYWNSNKTAIARKGVESSSGNIKSSIYKIRSNACC